MTTAGLLRASISSSSSATPRRRSRRPSSGSPRLSPPRAPSRAGAGSRSRPATGGRRGFPAARGHEGVKRIWAMRKKGVGLLGAMKGDKRPIPFVEDTAVPPENRAGDRGEFRAALDRRGLIYGMFGHVDAGVLHVRPAIDLKDPGQERLIRGGTEGGGHTTRN